MLCKVLIAEDEEIEREFLKNLLKEHFQNIVEVYTAKNGREALAIYEQVLPHLVLMDINMPMMNGLEAIEHMKQFHQQSKYIILTSYDYFDYAKEAIRLGVEDYVLKPSNPNMIIESVSHTISDIKMQQNKEASASALVQKYAQVQPILEQECLNAILMRNTELEIQMHLKQMNYIAKSAVCFMIEAPMETKDQMQTLKEDLCDMGYRCLYQYVKKMHVFYILHNQVFSDQDMIVIQNTIELSNLKKYAIGLGSIQNEIKNFSDSYVLAMRNARLYEEKEELVFPINDHLTSLAGLDIAYYSNQLLKCFQLGNEEKMSLIIHEFCQEVAMNHVGHTKQMVQELLKNLVNKLSQQLKLDIDISTLPQFHIKEEDTYQNIEISLHYVLHALFHPLKEDRFQQTNTLAKQAMTYIRKNYRKPITLNDLAKHLQVTPFYVSKLIKSSFQKNFTDVVAEIRIEEAKRMLKEHHLVKEIAFDVGFQSQSYFAKMFKKIVGVTPKEYQEFFH